MDGNHLFYGDNLTVLRERIGSDSVDLIYLDPPFNSNASYNVLFKAPSGEGSAAQIEAFDDTWHWNDSAEAAFADVLRSGNGVAAEMLRAMRSFLGENDMMAYLAMMAVRLLELHRVLKPTGSLYLHCDPTASHYLKILLDAVFGFGCFKNDIVWKRTSAHNDPKQFGRVADNILFYTKGRSWTFNRVYVQYDQTYVSKFYRYEDSQGRYQLDNLTGPGVNKKDPEWRGFHPAKAGRSWSVPRRIVAKLATEDEIANMSTEEKLELLYSNDYIVFTANGTPRFKSYLGDLPGVQAQSIWTDVQPLTTHARERLGYPTQKPVALLERIVAASSNPGDVVLDPFCGCGTTVHAAEKLGRRWIGIDVTHLAIGLIEKRLRDAFPAVRFTTHGVPQDIEGARDLAARGQADPRYYYEFEKWAVSLLSGQPTRRSGDGGIDGNLYFGRTGRAIIEVKSGKVGSPQIARLRGAMERHKADIAVFLTLDPPNRGMEAEAAAAGTLQLDGFDPVPRLQIVTIEDALALRDRAVRLPLRRNDTFRRAAREEGRDAQGTLDF